MSIIRTAIIKWLNPLTAREECEVKAERVEDDAALSAGSSSFQMAGTSREALFQKLVAVKQGDTGQVLPAIDAIARCHDVDDAHLFDCIREVGSARPYEAGHLFRRLFDRASTKTRISVIKEFVSSPVMGDKHMVGDLFLSLLEHSTADERWGEIYPAISSIINGEPSNTPEVASKRAFLGALLKGWMSEI